MFITPRIKYNLKYRGREWTGQERNYDIRKLCDSINSPATQERVSTRGMLGFYGHLPRIRAGRLEPPEGTYDKDKYYPVEPAFLTTLLRAGQDGSIEHCAEFLDTASGQIASKLFQSHVGGFSSAIDSGTHFFAGFDYVIEPNYIDNSYRGIQYDSIDAIQYDDLMKAEVNEFLSGQLLLIQSIEKDREAQKIINKQLMDDIASLEKQLFIPQKENKRREQLINDIKSFHNAKIVLPKEENKEKFSDAFWYQRYKNRVGHYV